LDTANPASKEKKKTSHTSQREREESLSPRWLTHTHESRTTTRREEASSREIESAPDLSNFSHIQPSN